MTNGAGRGHHDLVPSIRDPAPAHGHALAGIKAVVVCRSAGDL
jgi:hypothetical protein